MPEWRNAMNRPVVLTMIAVAALVLLVPTAALARADAAHDRQLVAVVGQGSGIVNVRPTAAHPGLSSEITVSVHDAQPNTTFYVQRAGEVGRPLGSDGICQRASGLWPWEQPNSAGFPAAPAFVSLPRPLTGPLMTLTADADGAGTAHISFEYPAIADGTVFDVEFRLLDNLTAPTTDLRTGCFSVTAK
jgi:hypothetical protein